MISVSSQKISNYKVTFTKNIHQDPNEGEVIAYGDGIVNQ